MGGSPGQRAPKRPLQPPLNLSKPQFRQFVVTNLTHEERPHVQSIRRIGVQRYL